MGQIVEWIESWNTTSTMWIWFIPAAAITVFFALRMAKYADLIIYKSSLGGAFVGLTFVSLVTSIPELVTVISQSLEGSPSIGVSDILGANAWSIFCLAIVTIIFVKTMYVKELGPLTKISITLAFISTLAVTIFMFIGHDWVIGQKGVYAIGVLPFTFLIIYALSLYLSYRHKGDSTSHHEYPEEVAHTKYSLRTIFIIFAAYSLALVLFSFVLNWVTDGMQRIYSIPRESAGGLILSMTTAAPEVVALVSLAINGQMSAAFGGIIGSHTFNIFTLFFGDLAYGNGAIFNVEAVHNVWKIGLIVLIELATFMIFIFSAKKIRKKWIYLLFPSIILISYILGWILILSL